MSDAQPGDYQALVEVRDGSGAEVASLWMTLQVVQTDCFDPNATLTCRDEMLDDGSTLKICCSAPGCCASVPQ